MKKKIKSLRWVLLAAGIIAVVGLTAMNVYSLYTLRSSSIESERKSKQLQVAEFADRVRYRFYETYQSNGLASWDMDLLEQTFRETGSFTNETIETIYLASQDSIFQNIYYYPANSGACQDQGEILRFDTGSQSFAPDTTYPDLVCEGLGYARTRMKILIEGYRFNNKLLFDTNRSLIIALVNLDTKSVFGYLAMPIDEEYMVEDYLQPSLQEIFGNESESGLNVWLRNWTNGEIIAASNPGINFDIETIEFRQTFPDFFDDWYLYAEFDENLITAASKPSLLTNLIILGIAFIFLIGAMTFMFITAQRERALSERQSGFLANVTHELKTPLAVMQAAGENLADGRVDNQQRLKSYGSHIYSEAIRLRKMIDKLLDVAKADAGESFIHPKPVSPGSKVQKFIDEHHAYIKEKGFTLETSIPDTSPLIFIDKHSLDTILRNLINNAIKYSKDRKYIGVSLSHHGKDVILQVEDQGVGLSKKSINHIFEKFYRAEDTLTAQTKGYGLGLSIVKNLVELNGGTINVTSQEGRGTTFTVTFPVLTEEQKAKISTESAEPAPEQIPIKSPDYAN